MHRRPIVLIVATGLFVTGRPAAANGVSAPGSLSVGSGDPAGTAEVVGELERLAIDFDGAPGFILTLIVPEDGEAIRIDETAELAQVPAGAVIEAEIGPVTASNQRADDPDGGVTVAGVEVLDIPDGTAEPALTDPGDRLGDGAATTNAVTLQRTDRRVHVRTGRIGSQLNDSVTLEQVAGEVAGEVDTYWSQSTGGVVRFQVASQQAMGSYGGWGSTQTCTGDQIRSVLTWTADHAGIQTGRGTHALLYTPRFSTCGFAGVAHVADGGVAWINGPTSQRWAVMAHELGHNLTLGHSDSRVSCRRYSAADGFTSTCRNGDYGDAYDVMGTHLGGPGPLNAAHLDALGVLTGSNTVVAGGPTTVSLAPVGGLTGTRFLTFTSNGQQYYVEYRAAVGPDSDLANNRRGCPVGVSSCSPVRYMPGVVVRRVDGGGNGRTSYLLDAGAGDPRAAASDAWFVLPVGRSFTTADGSYILTVDSIGSGRATVSLNRPLNTVPKACPADVIAEDWFTDTPGPFENAIDCVWHWGVTTGTSPTTYAPTRSVNREQMAAFVARLITASGGTLPARPRDAFRDDDASSFEHQINQLAAVGIVNGKRPEVYGPKDVVTRGQMAAFLTRAYDYRARQAGLPALPSGSDAFPDDDGHPMEQVINKAAAAGFATGYADGTFRPGAAVRRDHMAAFLTRLLDPLVERRVTTVPQLSASQPIVPS